MQGQAVPGGQFRQLRRHLGQFLGRVGQDHRLLHRLGVPAHLEVRHPGALATAARNAASAGAGLSRPTTRMRAGRVI